MTKVVRIAGPGDVLSGAGALLAAGARHVQGARDILQSRQASSVAPPLHATERHRVLVLACLLNGTDSRTDAMWDSPP